MGNVDLRRFFWLVCFYVSTYIYIYIYILFVSFFNFPICFCFSGGGGGGGGGGVVFQNGDALIKVLGLLASVWRGVEDVRVSGKLGKRSPFWSLRPNPARSEVESTSGSWNPQTLNPRPQGPLETHQR